MYILVYITIISSCGAYTQVRVPIIHLLLLGSAIHLHSEVNLMYDLLGLSFYHPDNSGLGFHQLLLFWLLLYNHQLFLAS